MYLLSIQEKDYQMKNKYKLYKVKGYQTKYKCLHLLKQKLIKRSINKCVCPSKNLLDNFFLDYRYIENILFFIYHTILYFKTIFILYLF